MTQDDRALIEVGNRPMLANRLNVETMERFITMALTGPARPPPNQVRALAIVALKLGLHPLNNEVMLYEGQVYITIHGRRRLAERNGDLAAIQPDIVTNEERRKALGARQKGDIVAECRVYRRSDERPTIQYAILRALERWPSEKEAQALGITQEQIQKLRNNDDPDGLFGLMQNPRAKVRPVILYPEQMAMKRAESRALDSLAGVPLPTYDQEMGMAVSNGALPPQLAEAEPDVPPVAEEPAPSYAAEAEQQKPPLTLPRTVDELMAAGKRLGFKDQGTVIAALGLRGRLEIGDVLAAYHQLEFIAHKENARHEQ
ncbi:MAG: hypothetical protein A2V88_08770 [Elusimicrobia bacterium RBG_16_66_12]|nr:MAG: hypothetical protein A2V88_08770 [Elusimicrobia bacterium RBG_16_66_12]